MQAKRIPIYRKAPGTNIYYTRFRINPMEVPGEIPVRENEIYTPEQYYLLRKIKRHRETISGKYHFRT
ncbi:MAG: hypothetical protein AABW91_00915 [Nanoarchaeota archaeon]